MSELGFTLSDIKEKLQKQKRNIIILGICLLIAIGGVVVSLLVNNATGRKIEASQAKIKHNNKRVEELDNVLVGLSSQMTDLQRKNINLNILLDSAKRTNLGLQSALHIQKNKISKLKKDLYYERHKINYSDSTANAIIQGFSE
jgi:peptidoglycan hydrolase CwlO-like protein